MPEINIHGAGSGAGGKGMFANYADARAENANVDHKYRFAVREAKHLNDVMDFAAKTKAKILAAEANRWKEDLKSWGQSHGKLWTVMQNSKKLEEKVTAQKIKDLKAEDSFVSGVSRDATKAFRTVWTLREKNRKGEEKLASQQASIAKREADRIARDTYRSAHEENALRSSLDPNTYRMENARRVGNRGQRAADMHNWRELAFAKQELKRMERTHGSNPAMARTIAQARTRISVAEEALPPGMRAAGRLAGGAALMVANPYVDAALAVGGLAIKGMKLPFMIAEQFNKIGVAAGPYNDARLSLAGIARGNNSVLNSRRIEEALLPHTGTTPDWVNTLGLDAGTSVNILKQYGITPRYDSSAVNVIRQVGEAQNAPSLGGLGFGRYARSLGQATNMGLVNEMTGDSYFRTLRNVTEIAVAQGMDRSQSITSVENLLRQAAASGGVTMGNGGSMGAFFSRMAQSGFAGARTGDLQAQVLAGSNAANESQGFGGNSGRNMMVASAVRNLGGPAAFKDPSKLHNAQGTGTLDRIYGAQNVDQMLRTPGGEMLLKRVSQAADTGSAIAVANALIPFGRGNPQSNQNLYNLSDFPKMFGNGYFGTVVRQGPSGTGFGDTGQAAYDSITRNGGNGTVRDMYGRESRAPYANSEKLKAAFQYFRRAGWSKEAAAGLVANMAAESGGNEGAVNGRAYGAFQWMPGRQADFARLFGHSIQNSTFEEQMAFKDWELHNTESKAGAALSRATSAGQAGAIDSNMDERPGNTPAEKAHAAAVRSAYATSLDTASLEDPNATYDINSFNANRGAANLGASRAASNAMMPFMGGNVGDGMISVGNAVSRLDVSISTLTVGVDKLAGVINGLAGVQHNTLQGGLPPFYGPGGPALLGAPRRQ